MILIVYTVFLLGPEKKYSLTVGFHGILLLLTD
jgi:hypothetical protein